MIESFVDLTYRGLSLGRRVKLSQVRPSTGYLETPAPMPVGTLIQIATDEGLTLDAAVTGIHEQTGGSDKAPGMTVTPKLAGEASEAWWRARVTYPDEVKAAPVVTRAPSKVTVRPRSHTTPEPLATVEPEQMATDVIPVIAEGKATMIMPAIDQELLESLTRPSGDGGIGEIERLTRSTGEHEIVDDGKRTTIMEAIDPAALGLDFGSGNSGTFSAVSDEDSGPTSTNGDDKKPGGAKKKRKRR